VGEFFVLLWGELHLLLSEETVYEKPFGIERTRRASEALTETNGGKSAKAE
jgi:hypothetical protein